LNLLPVATPAAPANAAGSGDPATTGSGDFTALLAMLVGAASTTLPIDTPPELSGDTANSDDSSSLATPTPPPAVSLQAPELAPPTVAGTPDVSVPEPADAPVAAEPDAPAANDAAPGAMPLGPSRSQGAGPRGELPAEPAVPAPQGKPAVPAQPAVAAQEAAPPESPLGETLPAQAAHSTPLDGATPTPPAERAEEHERRPETMTLPDAAPFERPPLGSPDPPGRDPSRDHGTRHRQDAVSPPPSVDRLPVASPGAEHVDGASPSKPADRPSAASAPGAPTQVVQLVAANRSNTLAPVDEAPAAPAAPATVPEQIVSAVVPLHGRGDGRHEVTLELRPDNLGTIRVEVVVEHQTVHLTLHAAEPATSRLLSANLPDLRSALAEAGLTAGQVGVGLDGSGSGQRRSRPQAALHPSSPDRERATATVRTLRPMAAAGRLDLFL
jgi:hypothetical protein